MNLAKISSNGQITVPVEIRRLLGLKSGDKILFLQKQNGKIVVSNASAQAISPSNATDENSDANCHFSFSAIWSNSSRFSSFIKAIPCPSSPKTTRLSPGLI